MSLPPNTTPVPPPIFAPGMSHQTAAPTASPLPSHPKGNGAGDIGEERKTTSTESTSTSKKDFDLPKLRLRIDDISHPGAAVFLGAVNASTCLSDCVREVMRHLYISPETHNTHCPPTRSVTLILRDMDGVAYTTGSDLDSDHKEIHFSLRYIAGINPPARRTAEITGVITHELVHCYQWNALGSCPGGLIEGVADWVRLCCDLAPPHWRREPGGRWDGGYQHTAYFLAYLVDRFGPETVRDLNEKLRLVRYEAKPFWTQLVGRPVEQLWDDYKASFESGECK